MVMIYNRTYISAATWLSDSTLPVLEKCVVHVLKYVLRCAWVQRAMYVVPLVPLLYRGVHEM